MAPPTSERELAGKWWMLVVAANFAVEILQQGFLKSMGVLLPSLVDYFDTDYATMGTIVSVEFCTSYIGTPLWLFLSKKFNPRILATLGGLATGLSVICASFVQTTFMLGLCFFLTGLFASAVIQRGSIALREYCGKKFASMKTFTLMGSFVGGMCMPMLTAKIYQMWGLRTSILLFGGLLLHFVPIGLIYKTPTPQRMHGTKQMTDLRKHETTQCRSTSKVDAIETAPCLQDTESLDAAVSPRKTFLRMVGFISQALDVPALCEERLVSALLLPSKFLADVTYVGWYMFQVSLALSAGVDPNLASFLPVVTGLGGIVMRSLCTATLLYLPN
ncbi:monocarboxylate transporter 3-like, partial [Diadema antillarum]|uniref:monocarboxylate transporter 3-like n=1 Tax=Diadema antillarum TaxID=105358 RepID=UPI003A8B7DFF